MCCLFKRRSGNIPSDSAMCSGLHVCQNYCLLILQHTTINCVIRPLSKNGGCNRHRICRNEGQLFLPPPTSFFPRKDAKVKRRKRVASYICVSVFGEGRGDRTFLLPNPPPRRPLRWDTIRRRWASLSDRRGKSRGRADSPFLILTAIHVFDVCCLMLLPFWPRKSMQCCWKNLCCAIAVNACQVCEDDNKTQVVKFVSKMCVVGVKRTYLSLYIFWVFVKNA